MRRMQQKMTMGLASLLLGGVFAGLNTTSSTFGQDDAEKPATADERRQEQIEKLAQANEKTRKERAARSVARLREMQGAWQLVEHSSSSLPNPGRRDLAYLLVSGEFFSIEMHMAYFDETDQMKGRLLQTGTYRLNFGSKGNLMAQIMIGSIDEGDGYSEFRVPGYVSVYDVDVTGGVLSLISEDASRFRFERVGSGVLTELLYEETDWLPGAKRRAEREAIRALEAKHTTDPGEDTTDPVEDTEGPNEESPKTTGSSGS